ncbi:MAG TPA: hypothetical protein OIM28_04445 [Clostridiaceae bacterium]|jgi:hypothetical protein|nr:hypothetical protein [Clostridiaceae bacterium]
MKVLFAVNNDDISEAIIKKYQKEYKEILSYKNVYYFNAILKELQKDKSYDRVVISEDLEPFANNNYDTIDKFLFEKLDNISDEAIDEEGNNTDIILICADRRSKSDEMLVKLFGLGIYNAIIGQDRSIDEVCRLINKPRTKRDAKQYYKIESDSVNYQPENENNVSEVEIQNILEHYRRLGKNEDKYVDSFNNIVSQYNDIQLKIIIRYLPMGVKAVLEERSPKYQQLMAFQPKTERQNFAVQQEQQKSKGKSAIQEELIKEESEKTKISKPIVIPQSVNKTGVKRLIKETAQKPIEPIEKIEEKVEEIENPVDEIEEKPKRGRGRPKKVVPVELQQEEKPKRGRGRPPKNPIQQEEKNDEENDELIDLFNLSDEDEETKKTEQEEPIDLFDLGDNEEENDDEEAIDLSALGNDENETDDNDEEIDLFNLGEENKEEKPQQNQYVENKKEELVQTAYKPSGAEFNSLITKDKKVVAFVGTTKNGTSFIVNNVAEMLSSTGISTAILDMSTNKNAYYVYTNNEEQLMNTAKESIYKLRSGVAEGVRVNKNLSVFTSLPEEQNDYSDAETILSTLLKNFSVVLIDCDFDTPMEYFDKAQEIYLVQSMDVLTMQPLTAFLRNLQSKNILRQEKLKIVINKSVKIKSVSVKRLIDGISNYNDPSMTYMKNLFDPERIAYCEVPLEIPNYIKYLDSMINCSISLNGYTKPLMMALKQLTGMVYPLINRQTYSPRGNQYKDNFSSNINSTLNKMKNKYQQ